MKKIGLLASGVGELGIMQSLENSFPGVDFVYWGDTARYPLSSKSDEVLLDSLQDGLDYMQDQQVEAVILASADLALAWILAYEDDARTDAEAGVMDDTEPNPMLETLFEPVGGAYGFCVLNPLPSYGSVLWRNSKAKKIGMLAGETFIGSGLLPEIIMSMGDEDCGIYAKDSGLLGALVANGWRKRPEAAMIVKKHVKPLKDRHIDVLAVTDADNDLLLAQLEDKSGKRCGVELFSFTVLDVMEEFLETQDLPESGGSADIFLTDYTENTLKNARRFYRKKISPA